MISLTLAEINLMILYNPGSRMGLVAELNNMTQYLTDDEDDLRSLSHSVIRKLNQMTDSEFDALDLSPDTLKGW